MAEDTNSSIDNDDLRTRGRDEHAADDDRDGDDDFRELAIYQSRAEVDMFSPRLEDAGIRYEIREMPLHPDDRPDGVEPRTHLQVMVPFQQLRHAREVLDDFESQRDVTNFEVRPRPEPEDIGRDEDMTDPPQPKMKF